MKKLILTTLLLSSVSAYAGNSGAKISKGIGYAAIGYMGYNIYSSKEEGSKCSGQNYASCVMMALYAAQAIVDGNTAGSARTTTQSFIGGAGEWPNFVVGPGMTGQDFDTTLRTNNEQLTPLLAEAEKNGIDVDPKTGKVNTPKNGPMDPGALLSSSQALVDAGLIEGGAAEEIDKKLAAYKKNRPQFKNIAMTSTAGGGYSGNRNVASTNWQDSAYAGYKFNFDKEKPNAPKTAGLVRYAGGEAIGAQSDNIFDMLHRRYQQKSSERIFVGQEQD